MNTQDKNGDSRKTTASFADLVRKVALASVGAMVVAQEEIEDFVGKLVQKGELAEKDGKTLVKDLMEKRAQRDNGSAVGGSALPIGANASAAVTSAIDTTVDKVLHKINIPTKTDVEELARKMEELDKKIEALAARRIA